MRFRTALIALLVVCSGCSMLGGSPSEVPSPADESDSTVTTAGPDRLASTTGTPNSTGRNETPATTSRTGGTKIRLERASPEAVLEYDGSERIERAIAAGERPVYKGGVPRLDSLERARYVEIDGRFYDVVGTDHRWLHYRVGVQRVSPNRSADPTPVSELPEQARNVVETAIAEGRYFSADEGPREVYVSASHYEHARFGVELDERLFRADGTTYRFDSNLSFVLYAYRIETVSAENASGTAIPYDALSPAERRFVDAAAAGERRTVWGGTLERLGRSTIVVNGTYYRFSRPRAMPSRPNREMYRFQVDARRVANATVYEDVSAAGPSTYGRDVAAALRTAASDDWSVEVGRTVADRIRALADEYEYVVVGGDFYEVCVGNETDRC